MNEVKTLYICKKKLCIISLEKDIKLATPLIEGVANFILFI